MLARVAIVPPNPETMAPNPSTEVLGAPAEIWLGISQGVNLQDFRCKTRCVNP